MPESQLLLADDHLVLVFPYDKDQVDEIKRIKNSKWDKIAKVWRVPMTSLNSARDFAAKHDFWIEPDVLKFDLPEPDNHVFGVMLEKDWIYLSFSFDPVKVKSVKQIPSITWHAKTKSWRAPITSIHECIDWAKKFREVLPQDLEDLAAGIFQKHQESVKESRAVDADISVAGLPLLPYQRAGVKYAAAARRTFIADDMGLGKTIQAIATVEYVHDSYPAVVVCPPNLVLNWVNEYQKWLPSRKVVAVTDRKSFPEENFDVLIVGYSNITHWEKRLTGMRSYVFDESHYIKTPTSQRTKSAIKMSKSAPPEGIVLALTGTPVTNRPAEYASQLDAIGRLDKFGGLWGFYRRYCGAFRDRFGQWNLSGHSNLDELNEKLRGNCYIRRTKDQVLEDLPPVRHAPLVVNGTPAAMKEYRKAEDNIVEYLVARAKEIAEELGVSVKSAAVLARIKAESNEHMVRLSVLRRLAAKAKMEAAKEIVESHIESGQKVVVAAHHRDIVDELAVKFGDLRIQGGMKVEDVEAAKSRFQNEPVGTAPVIVLSIQAAKTGHTLTAAQDVLFMELPWTPADIDQTYSRCHRLGQKGSVTATYLLCDGTVDQQIYDLIEAKRSVVNVATDGGEVDEAESLGSALVGLFTEKGLA